MSNVNNEVLLIVFVALTGAAVLMQACVPSRLYIAVRKTYEIAEEQMSEVSVNGPACRHRRKHFSRARRLSLDSVATDSASVLVLRTQGLELQSSYL